jgi:hypothetical protein
MIITVSPRIMAVRVVKRRAQVRVQAARSRHPALRRGKREQHRRGAGCDDLDSGFAGSISVVRRGIFDTARRKDDRRAATGRSVDRAPQRSLVQRRALPPPNGSTAITAVQAPDALGR